MIRTIRYILSSGYDDLGDPALSAWGPRLRALFMADAGLILVIFGGFLSQLMRVSPACSVAPERSQAAATSLDWQRKAAQSYQSHDWSTCVDATTEALKLEPANAVLFMNRGACHMKLGEEGSALADARRSCELGGAPGCALVRMYGARQTR